MKVERNEIFYADLSPVVGSEQGGIRPVLIVQNDAGNTYSPTTIVVPITSILDKHKLPTHVMISNTKLPKNSMALCEQIKTIDKKRLKEFVCRISEKQQQQIDKALRVSLRLI